MNVPLFLFDLDVHAVKAFLTEINDKDIRAS